MTTLGSAIRGERIKKAISAESLAEASKMPTQRLYGIEAGRIDPRASELESIAAALSVPVVELMQYPVSSDSTA